MSTKQVICDLPPGDVIMSIHACNYIQVILSPGSVGTSPVIGSVVIATSGSIVTVKRDLVCYLAQVTSTYLHEASGVGEVLQFHVAHLTRRSCQPRIVNVHRILTLFGAESL